MKARCRLMTRMPWYGHMAMMMKWIPSDMEWLPEPSRTMGVRVICGGDIECIYYPPYVDAMSLEEIYATVQHEIEHVVRCHCIRTGTRDNHKWNIACDMCVNGSRDDPRIGYHATDGSKNIILPLDGNIYWIPKDWHQDGTAEQYYDKLMTEDHGNIGSLVDDHSVWDQSDVSADEMRQIVKDAVDQASLIGNAPGHLAEAIEQLSRPVVRWRELLRQHHARYAGSRRWTFSRRNRRRQQFGIKGISHHAASSVMIIVDSSTSVDQLMLQTFFSEIEAISYRSKVWLLQWDYGYQGVSEYRRGDWRKILINGRGGTDMTEPLIWLRENQMVKDLQIMFTDGYTPWLDTVDFPIITAITTKDAVAPKYGHTIRIGV